METKIKNRNEELAKKFSEIFGIEKTDELDFLDLLSILERTEEKKYQNYSSYFVKMTANTE